MFALVLWGIPEVPVVVFILGMPILLYCVTMESNVPDNNLFHLRLGISGGATHIADTGVGKRTLTRSWWM
jgi:hypothetical protein